MKRKINLITICLLFLLFGLVGCGNVQSTKKVQAVPTQVQSQTQGRESYNKNLYRNQENKFSIIFPDQWRIGGGRGEHVVVVATNTTDGSSINILVRALPNEIMNMTIDQLSDSDIQEIINFNISSARRGFPDVNLEGSGTTYINNKKAIWIKTTQTYRYPDKSFKLTQMIYMIWTNGKLYQIAASASPQKFNAYAKIFEEVAGSFVYEGI